MPHKGIEVTACRLVLLVALYERKGGLAVMLSGLFARPNKELGWLSGGPYE